MRSRNAWALAFLLLAAPLAAPAQDGCPNAATSSCFKDDSILLDSGKNLDEAIGTGDLAPASSTLLTVCDGGSCDASVICDNGCTEGAACAAGSAIAQAAALAPTESSPVTVTVLPSSTDFDECVAINDLSWLTLVVEEGATIHPSGLSNDGGAIQIGSADTSKRHATNIRVVVDGTVINDTMQPPEAGIQIGQEQCGSATFTPSWDHVDVTVNGKVIGRHDGIQWCGAAENNEQNLPHLSMRAPGLVVTAADGLAKKGNSIDHLGEMNVLVQTNYVESTDETYLDERTGTAQAGSGAATLVVEAGDDCGVDECYRLRHVTFTDNGPGCAGTQAVITDYDTDTDTATFFQDADTISTGCDYTIAAVGDYEAAPLRYADWSAQGGLGFGQWKMTCLHFGNTGPDTTVSPFDLLSIDNLRCRIRVNDASLGNNEIAGVLAYESERFKELRIQKYDIDIEVAHPQGVYTPTDPFMAGVKWTDTNGLETMNLGDGTIRLRLGNPAVDSDLILRAPIVMNNTLGGRVLNLHGTLRVQVDGAAADDIITDESGNDVNVNGQIIDIDGQPLRVGGPADVNGWKAQCGFFDGASGTTPDHALYVPTMANGSFVAQQVSCSSRGDGTNGAVVDFGFNTKATSISNDVTCEQDTDALVWVDSDSSATVADGVSVTVDTASNDAADDLLACVRVLTDKWRE